jgi:hypothetical protein
MTRRTAADLILVSLIIAIAGTHVPSARAWGDEGHRFINRVAADKLPSDMPSFFRESAARLSYLGPEPDRWRDTRGGLAALAGQNGPDHFIDIDSPESFDAIPNDRYQYSEWLRAKGKDAKAIGFLPYSILEGYEKVLVLFRLWRDPRRESERAEIEQNIVYSAGVMGHYVADGSQPLHATIHFNGWSGSSNPESFTREPLHGRFESDYVKANIKPEDFSGMVKPARVLKDPFSDIMKYLFDSYNRVPELYRMDKTARWDASNHSPEAKQFVSARLAAGSQMLGDLWYTAWVNSAGAERRQ